MKTKLTPVSAKIYKQNLFGERQFYGMKKFKTLPMIGDTLVLSGYEYAVVRIEINVTDFDLYLEFK
ncbi:hypothetical protein MZM54_00275 [[Brevibacterium] frigoritolerans]|nr:hypothetical protein [Peribacillus frigoritolerans]